MAQEQTYQQKHVQYEAQGFSISTGEKPAEDEEQKFETSGCRDGLWAALFLVQLGGIIALAVVYGEKYQDRISIGTDLGFMANIWELTAILVGAGAAITLIMLSVVSNPSCSRSIIYFTFYLCAALWFICAISAFSAGYVVTGLIYLLFFAFQLLYIKIIGPRIAFATAMLEVSVGVIKSYKATIFVSLLGTLAQAGWIFIWMLGVGYFLHDHRYGNTDKSLGGFVVFVLILSMFWTAQVIANLVHVTVAGLVATWYFAVPRDMPKNPTWKAFKRAATTSFGSICLGSLVVAITQTLRAMMLAASGSQNNFLRSCAYCLLACIENIVKYVNVYAFSRVAIYGQPYCHAAKQTWAWFNYRGFDAIINDDLTGNVMFVGSLIGGIANLGIALLCTTYLYPDMPTQDENIWRATGFFIGFLMVLCSMVVVRSAVATIFVCFSEDPAVFQNTKSNEYNKIKVAWNGRYGDLVSYPGTDEA